MVRNVFPPLENWAPTRDSLNLYARAVGVVPRALSKPHPKWWHISLKVMAQGAATDPIPHRRYKDKTLGLAMNLLKHSVDLSTSDGEARSLNMSDGLNGSEFGDQLLLLLEELGIEGKFERELYRDESPRQYDAQQAESYLAALQAADAVLKDHRSELVNERGPVQLWPHNFDLAFEWFGTLMVSSEQDGQTIQHPSQINFGFAPGDSSHKEAYFYSNPWPFQESFVAMDLPSGASWFTESWKGSLLPYAAIAGDEAGAERLRAYYQAVYELASPLLLD